MKKIRFITTCIILSGILLLAAAPALTAPGGSETPWKTITWQTIPWESTPEFRAAVQRTETPIRMAAFSATLKDPLPGEMSNVSHAADMLAGTVVKPGEIFSQNRTLGPYTLERGYRKGPTYSGGRVITTIGGGVCKIASVMYNVVRLSNLQVLERHNHSMTVPYVPPGQDATVYYGSRDIKFLNNSGGPVLIWAKTYGNTLYMALYGQEQPPVVTWHHETLKDLKTWTIYHFNPGLTPGEEKEAAPGQDGIVVKSWITIKYPDGKEETKKLGKDYYSPSPRIVERGPKK